MQLARPSKALYKIAPIRRYALMRDINEKLEKWDVLPLGDKLKNIRKTHSVVLNRLSGGTHNFPRDFGFRLSADMLNRNDLVTAERHLRKRLNAEEHVLTDMRNVFAEWGVGVDPTRISHPFRTCFEEYEGTMLFTSPAMEKIYKKIEKTGRRACSLKLPHDLDRVVRKNKSFGLARLEIADEDKAHLKIVQPFRFFIPERDSVHGVKGSGMATPIKDAHLLFFYFALRKASLLGAKRLYACRPYQTPPYPPHDHIYREIIDLAPIKKETPSREEYSIFIRRQRGS